MNYRKIYDQIITRGKSRKLVGYKEKHHIIPKCMNGSNEPENMVELTGREHFICHKLLTEIYPDENGLQYSVWIMMTMSDSMGRKYKVGSKEYQRLRENLIVSDKTRKKMSESRLGLKHSNDTLEKMKKPKPVGFGEKISKLLKDVPKSEKHKQSLRVPKSVESWSKGMENRWNETQLKNNRNNQPSVRKVDQYNLDGEFIKTWDSITETKTICSGVPHCLMEKQKTSGGYIWKYNNNEPPNQRKGGKK